MTDLLICSIRFVPNDVISSSSFISLGLKVRLAPKNLTQYRSQYVVFRCYVAGNPYPIVSWYANNQRITEGPRHKLSSIKGGEMLRIGRLHPILDTTIIECRARNGVDSPVADHASLNVSFNYFCKYLCVFSYCKMLNTRHEIMK